MNDRENGSLFKGIFVLHAILFFHVLLIALVGLLVIFLRGVEQFMVWIFLAGVAGMMASGLLIYRRMKAEGRSLRELTRLPLLENKTVEVSLLGGIVSLRIDGKNGAPKIGSYANPPGLQLEDAAGMRMRELEGLARLAENKIISTDEYSDLKNRIMGG